MAAGVVRQRITGMRILVIRLLADSYSGKLPAHVQQSLDPIGLRRCRTRPRGGRVGKGVLAVRRRTRDSTHRCGVPPSVLQGLPRYGEPDAGGDGLALRSPGQTLEKRTVPSRARRNADAHGETRHPSRQADGFGDPPPNDGNHRNYHPMCELYQTWLGAIHARDKALELTNRLRSRKDAGLSASNVARIAEPELANQGNFNLRSSDHAQEGGFALIHRASATVVAARKA